MAAAGSLKKMLSHSAVYGVGTVLAKATSVIMLPIYTRYLTPADYGLLELLSLLTDLTALLFGMRIFTGVYRYYFDTDDVQRKNEVISTALIANVAMHAIGVFFLVCLSYPASILVMKDSSHQGLIVAFAFSLLTMSLTTVPMLYIRAQQKPWFYLMVSASKLALQVLFNVIFVVVLHWGPAGIVASTLITGLIIGTSLSLWVTRHTGLRFSKDVVKRLITFGWPLMLANLGSFYLSFGDRMFLQHYWGLAVVGLYALAYRFGYALYSVAFGTFMLIWSTESYQVYRQDNRLQIFQRTFILTICSMIFLATGLCVFAKEILQVMSAPEFLPAHLIIPFVVASCTVKAATDYCSFSVSVAEKTKHFLQASILSTIVMTVGYAALIPSFGGMGAGAAALVGTLAELWWVVRTGSRYFDMQLPWKKVAFVFGSGAVVYGISVEISESSDTLILTLALKALLMAGFLVALFFSPIMSSTERNAVFGKARTTLQRLAAGR